jgi:hypothetical protein
VKVRVPLNVWTRLMVRRARRLPAAAAGPLLTANVPDRERR